MLHVLNSVYCCCFLLLCVASALSSDILLQFVTSSCLLSAIISLVSKHQSAGSCWHVYYRHVDSCAIISLVLTNLHIRTSLCATCFNVVTIFCFDHMDRTCILLASVLQTTEADLVHLFSSFCPHSNIPAHSLCSI